LGYKDNISLILKYTLIIGSLPLWYGLIRDMFRGSFGVDNKKWAAMRRTIEITNKLNCIIFYALNQSTVSKSTIGRIPKTLKKSWVLLM
jgi:hypothetical protein